ncbi:MAG: tRNA 4-thiouridine(8) synthase ThiI [Desulfococcaceae bacterium]|jgi:tRNA U34 2-thiouridine synthase MnmA/TrmU|nr:tRNA 4-thiouridine(8) synthase ThiI [Desulfococcaceae bacterium]
MTIKTKKVTALGLCSGGLDSILAGVVLREQGIDARWISFETPFFSADKARKAARMTGIPLTVRNITSEYLKMLRDPACKFGKNMNPCMDCHALMFRIAGGMMREQGADFLFSGEVMGQRPMSQTKNSLRYVEKHSGFDGYIVRPLSMQKLPETIPEKQGLLDRESLYGISGRSRRDQIALAEKFGIRDYPAPAGGCLLTDKIFSIRLRDLFRHQEQYTEEELHLLKFGRHFRIDSQSKIIVGRDKADNEGIFRHFSPEQAVLLKTPAVPGPAVLLSGSREHLPLAAGICVGYSRVSDDLETEVQVRDANGKYSIRVKGIPPQEIRPYLIQS